MALRHVVGGILMVPTTLAGHLVWLSGVVLHFFTAFAAFSLAGSTMFLKILVGLVALALPIVAEIAVAIWSWSATGNLVNGYTEWLFLWLGFAATVGVLMAAGYWLAKD